MKQVIRFNTFETNSSSEHTLIIIKDPIPYNHENSILGFEEQDDFELFGCCDTVCFERYPFQVLYRPDDKLRYWVARKIGTERHLEYIPEVISLISKHTGLSENNINIKTRSEYHNEYGYCSLNDTGESPWEYLDKNNISLEEFIFNPKYLVVLDGDERQELEKLFKSGIMNLDNIEYIGTGKDYWDPNVITIYGSWILEDYIDKSFKNIHKNVVKLIINFTYTKSPFNQNKIKDYINKIKSINNNIIIELQVDESYIKKLSKQDLKLFDIVNKI